MIDLAISTCLVTRNAWRENGEYLLNKLVDEVGLTRLELEYRLTPTQIREVTPLIRARGLTVTSLHNFCPPPPGLHPQDYSGDAFNLSSVDQEERGRAIRFTTATLELASELEARTVVVHLGRVEIKVNRGVIKDACEQQSLTPDLARQVEERAQAAPKALDAVSFSLEALAERARELGVSIGLENRYHAYQSPSLEETAFLLERFAGAPLGPWLDVGHAHVQQCAGLDKMEDWLERFGGSFIGCHLHDAVGYHDHQAPGQGDMDWPYLAEALVDVPLKVLEIHPGPSYGQVRDGAEMLAREFDRARNRDRAGNPKEMLS